ncbi:hypothetical protein [Cupriavidus basilensis]|uniref:hypothetical protein n=1 Tax=Cupriavidus basilensis TaxID=68895 RepID=UPI0023E880AC|nr:hypothetical protein [Cupriavidus basilensis]MDF3883091.1 hypothetical protein [Cupriavidus basilensis]
MTTLAAFPTAEREAFTNACRRHGFIAADFSVCDVAAGEQDRLVSVLRPETGVLMQYAAGSRNSWSTKFEHDLAIGFFGDAPE